MSLLSAASTWWAGHIGAPDVQTNLIDPINGLADSLADLGYITTGIVTATNGSTITSQKGRVIGNRAWLRVTYTIGTAAVTALGAVGTTGALTNTPVLNIADADFQTTSSFANQALPAGSAGRGCIHAVFADNSIQLCSVAGSAAISNGDTFSFSGSYLLD
jgi:hypothetical protein